MAERNANRGDRGAGDSAVAKRRGADCDGEQDSAEFEFRSKSCAVRWRDRRFSAGACEMDPAGWKSDFHGRGARALGCEDSRARLGHTRRGCLAPLVHWLRRNTRRAEDARLRDVERWRSLDALADESDLPRPLG